MEFKTKDLESDVEINTTSGLVPLDTSIEVDIIGKNHKEYERILKAIKKDNADIYDLKLFSESLDNYITELPNGKFKVKIPLKTEYKNKELKVYYVADDGSVETYEVIEEIICMDAHTCMRRSWYFDTCGKYKQRGGSEAKTFHNKENLKTRK